MNPGRQRLLAAATIFVAIVAASGYVVFNRQTPLSLKDVVDRFHAANDGVTSGIQRVGVTEETAAGQATQLPRSVPGGQASGARSVLGPQDAGSLVISMPAEGVYTYDGTGSEGIGPYRRHFPTVSRRILTHEDEDTWLEHHVFTEERASWTLLSTTSVRRLVHHQRNYVKVGPYAEDRTLPFVPPLPAALYPPRAGHSWEGEFTGTTNKGEDYTGSYEVKAIDDKEWVVGDVRTRVFGFEIRAAFEGEFNGTASVKYWYSTEYGMSVREDYSATATIGPIVYQGEWSVRLRSLTPQT